MVKIEAVIQPFKLDEVKAKLDDLGVEVTMVSEFLDQGGGSQRRSFYRGAEYRLDSPKVKLEMLASSGRADEIVDAILHSARATAPISDGTILVYEVADAIRIRTGARLQYALA